jgi:hypothetical protein
LIGEWCNSIQSQTAVDSLNRLHPSTPFGGSMAIIERENGLLLVHKAIREKHDFEFDSLLLYSVDSFENETQTRRGPILVVDRFLGTIQSVKGYLI